MNTFQQIKAEYKKCQDELLHLDKMKGSIDLYAYKHWKDYYEGYSDAILRIIGIMGYSLNELNKD